LFTKEGKGGHMSRRHPGQSVSYKKKAEIRKKNAAKREIHQKVRNSFFF